MFVDLFHETKETEATSVSAGLFLSACMYASASVRHGLLLPAQGVQNELSELTLLPVMARLSVPCAVVCVML